MKGGYCVSNVKTQTNVAKVAEMVPGDESGIGKGFVNAKVKVVETAKFERPLGFVTVGAPSAKIVSVIAAFKTEIGKTGN